MINKEEILEMDKFRKMLETKVSDCNKCPHLNITEEEQDEIYQKTGIKPPHICNKYKAKVIHRCALSYKEDNKIFPLEKCDTKEIETYFVKEVHK